MNAEQESLFHSIRLNGPWMGIAKAEGTETSFKIKLPTDWSAAPPDSFDGEVVLSRSFGGPSGLGLDQPVFLTIEKVGEVEVELNGSRLGHSQNGQFVARVDQLLKRTNRLMLRFKNWSGSAKTLEGVCLRIQE